MNLNRKLHKFIRNQLSSFHNKLVYGAVEKGYVILDKTRELEVHAETRYAIRNEFTAAIIDPLSTRTEKRGNRMK